MKIFSDKENLLFELFSVSVLSTRGLVLFTSSVFSEFVISRGISVSIFGGFRNRFPVIVSSCDVFTFSFSTFGFVILFAMIIIFLCLAALFESFRDPLIILISVPMSICGAMIFISLGLGGASLNIYTEVGLVTLIGLISKHGILIVQFANDLQREGKSKREAVEMAANIRFRPILMTTASMVLGVLVIVNRLPC